MALIRCSECGQTVSDKAATCPRCGNPIAASNGNNNWLYWLIGALALVGLILFFTLIAPNSCSGNGTKSGAVPATDTASAAYPKAEVANTAQEKADVATKETKEEVEKPSGRSMYFTVIGSYTTLEAAKDKVNNMGSGFVVKGYSKGATRYRVCTSCYDSKHDAKSDMDFVRSEYTDDAWILTEKEGAIVYRR